jgi:WD40 repeat protein
MPPQKRRTGRLQRALQWLGRHPFVAGFLTAGLLAAAVLAVGARQLSARMAARQARLQRRLEDSRRSLYALQLNLVSTIWESHPSRGLALLEDVHRCPEDLRDFTWGYYYRLCKRDRATLADTGGPVAVSPDGKLLATASVETSGEDDELQGVVSIWDAATAQPLGTLRGHGGAQVRGGTFGVTSLAFSGDGSLLASGGHDGIIRLWQRVPPAPGAAPFKERASLRGHRGQVNALAFSPDGKTLASAGGRHWVDRKAFERFSELKLWDVSAGKERAALQDNQGEFWAVAFSPDGKLLAATNDAQRDDRDDADPAAPVCGTLQLWDVSAAKPRLHASLARAPEEYRAVAFSPDGKTLAARTEQALKLWDVATGKEPRTLEQRPLWDMGVNSALAFSPDGRTLATVGGRHVQLWDPVAGKRLTPFRWLGFIPTSLAFAPDGKTLVTDDRAAHCVWLIALAVDSQPRTLSCPITPFKIAFSPDGTQLAAASVSGAVWTWEAATGRTSLTRLDAAVPLRALPSLPGNSGPASPDGRTLAVGQRQLLDDPTAVQLCDPRTGQERVTLHGHASAVRAAAFAPDGLTLATADEGGTIKLWSAAPYRGLAPEVPEEDSADEEPEADEPRWAEHGLAGSAFRLGLFFVVLMPVLYLSTVCHEVGHAVVGRCVGFVVPSFGLGLGRPFLVWRLRGTIFYLGRTRPLQGITFTMHFGRPPARWRKAAMLAGGVSANALLALAAWPMFTLLPAADTVWWTVLAINGSAAVLNLVPFSQLLGPFRVHTDGGQILQALRGRVTVTPPPELVEKTMTLRGLWRDIGDYANLYYHLMAAAAAWDDLGAVEAAEELCREAEALPPTGWPVLRAWGALVRGAVAGRAGRFAESAALLDEAEAGYRELGQEVGQLLAAWTRADLLRDQGDPAGALRALDALPTQPLPAGVRGAVAAGVLASRLYARAALDDLAGAEALRAEYEAAPPKGVSAARDVRVYRALARLYVRREDWSAAEAAYRKALQAVGKLHALFHNPPEQARYAQAQAGLVDEARACLARLGKDKEDLVLREAVLAPEDVQRRRQAVVQRQQRRQRRSALGLVLVNAAVFAGLVAFLPPRGAEPLIVRMPNGVQMEARPATTAWQHFFQLPLRAAARFGPSAAVFVVSLVLWTAVALVLLLLAAPTGRLIPALRQRAGKWALFLAILPWLIWVGWYLLPSF